MRLNDVNLLFQLFDEGLHGVLVGPGGDGVAVDVFNARGRHVEAFDVKLATREDVGHQVQDTGKVLGENDDGVEFVVGIALGSRKGMWFVGHVGRTFLVMGCVFCARFRYI